MEKGGSRREASVVGPEGRGNTLGQAGRERRGGEVVIKFGPPRCLYENVLLRYSTMM